MFWYAAFPCQARAWERQSNTRIACQVCPTASGEQSAHTPSVSAWHWRQQLTHLLCLCLKTEAALFLSCFSLLQVYLSNILFMYIFFLHLHVLSVSARTTPSELKRVARLAIFLLKVWRALSTL